jgi:hypothetical protein
MSYRPLYEDPTYDDDGNCVDEDAEWQDLEVPEGAYQGVADEEIYSPYCGA